MLDWLRRTAGDPHSRVTKAREAVAARLRDGQRRHQAGAYGAAERCYRRVLAAEPDNVEAVHLLGRLYLQCERYEEAERLLRQAVDLRPERMAAHRDLGKLYTLQQRLDAAAATYRRALARNVEAVDLRLDLAAVLVESGQLPEATACLEEVVKVQPEHVGAQLRLGLAYWRQHRYEDASACWDQVLRLEPQHAKAHYHQGVACEMRGCDTEAISHFEQAGADEATRVDAWIRLGALYRRQRLGDKARRCLEHALATRPDAADAHFALALLAMEDGDDAAALDSLNLALHYKPELAEAYFHRGNLHRTRGDNAEAQSDYRQAIRLNPSFAAAYCNLGVVLHQEGDRDGALAHYERALTLGPATADMHLNMSVLLREQGSFEEAEHHARRALELNPRLDHALANLAGLLQERGEVDEAMRIFDDILAIHPDFAPGRWGRARLHLLTGNFAAGWRDYETRWRTGVSTPRNLPFPEWRGESLSGRTVLVYAEQGLGDEVMFASCLPDLLDRAERCCVECDPRLVELFRRSFPAAEIYGHRREAGRVAEQGYAWLTDLGHVDVQVPIGSLPLYFRNATVDFPHHTGYLQADPRKKAYWRTRLDGLGPGRKIGISWRGGTHKTDTARRSVDLERWLPVLQTRGLHFISLQYTDCSQELLAMERNFNVRVHHWQDAIDDYDETAALVCALDLVVSVGTSVVSLTGALGQPVWVLVPSNPGWMFLRQGEQMPWFPSARLFRQSRAGEWGDVMERVAEDLVGGKNRV